MCTKKRLIFAAIGSMIFVCSSVQAQWDTKSQSFTIAGTISVPRGPVAGASLRGFPGDPKTGQDGTYQVRVPRDWTGTVTPVKEGYVFEPPTRSYQDLKEHCRQENYQGEVIQYTISGNITLGEKSIAGVTVRGFPHGPIETNQRGYYETVVQYGWSGEATPSKEGCTFSPAGRPYHRVQEACLQQDYAGKEKTLVISGNTGAAKVSLLGLPGQSVSDQKGDYRVSVPYGWYGEVQPLKEGYSFEPPRRSYNAIIRDRVHENYTDEVKMLTIEGEFVINGNPIPGVKMKADNGGGSDMTDSQGRYRVQVPYGWSGTLIPSKTGWDFSPGGKDYRNVTEDIDERKAKQSSAPMVDHKESNIMVIPTAKVSPEEFSAISKDMRVMLHILKRELKKNRSEAHSQSFVFTDFGGFFDSHTSPFEAMYIQDYGVLFFLKADFVVSPTDHEEEDVPEDSTQSVDSVWQEAKQELFFQGRQPRRRSSSQPQPTATELADQLIPLLKHAVNLSHLEPQQILIVTVLPKSRNVIGSPSQVNLPGGYGGLMLPQTTNGITMQTGRGGGNYGSYTTPSGNTFSGIGTRASWQQAPAASTLTIHAHKKDIDAYADGKITAEEFHERVTVTVY
ncbi:hypothetical protein ACFL6U_01240 [Planctomycetota bacterium]